MTSMNVRAGIIGLAAVTIAVAACTDDAVDILPPKHTPVSPIFASYVSLGNSITAGYQSSGINDSTQRESYAQLLARQMGTQFNYPALKGPGCPPPIDTFTTQHRVGGGTSGTCALRDSTQFAIINNVAVPGASSIDLTAASTYDANILTSLFLGGKSQVQKALDAQPTFATVWMGNNDVLDAAAKGLAYFSNTANAGERALLTQFASPGITPPATFISNYRTGINQLMSQGKLKGGVLIGVVNVTAIPLLFPAESLYTNPVLKAKFDAAAGGTVTLVPNCTGSRALLSFAVAGLMRTGTLPRVVSCQKGVPAAPIGDVFVLDTADQRIFNTNISAYNTYIAAKADSIGFAYFDPNVALAQLKAAGQIPVYPDIASPKAPFGAYISLDGVHPSGAAHKLVASSLITLINAKYQTSIPAIQ
ncbi:MAG TPA: SGNH/GDSL hydrolase family protein [Gemmatimonadaceae bacterium]